MKKVFSFKRVISFVFVLVILSALCAPVFAEENTSEKIYMVDEASLLTDDQFTEVNNKLASVSEDKDVDVIAITVTDDIAGGSSNEAIADWWYKQPDVKSDCVILVYNVSDNKAWISDWEFGTKAVGEDHRSEIGSEVRPYLNSGDYYTAFMNYANAVSNRIDDAKREQLIHLIIGIAVCVIIGVVIAVVVALAIRSKYKPVRLKAEANDYLVAGSFNLKESYDRFVYSHVSRTRRSKDSDSGGSSSSSHSGGSI